MNRRQNNNARHHDNQDGKGSCPWWRRRGSCRPPAVCIQEKNTDVC